MFLRLVIACCLVATVAQVRAETVYIRDTLYVPLRGGQSIEHRILHRGLQSGTELERLEVNDETGYSRVRTQGGLEGWLQTQYLVEEPIASTQLEGVETKLEQLEAEHQQTLLRLREANETTETVSGNQALLNDENSTLREELEALTALSSNVVAIDEENKRLAVDRQDLLGEIEALNRQNQSLSDDRAQEWFLRGAGTVLIGLLFGFWVGRRIYSRRTASGWT